MRRAALQVPSKFFVCNQCLRQAPRRSPSPILNIVRSRGYADAKPLENLAAKSAAAAATQAQAQASKEFPKKTTSKGVAVWLLGSAASVFGIVVFGGLTRLTESGYGLSFATPIGVRDPNSLANNCTKQIKHNGMETCHWLFAAHVNCRLGIRV